MARLTESDRRKELNDGTDEAWWGSSYGPELDLVAPGIHIRTTDIAGTRGYVSGDYYTAFNGTSSAAPLVAGVVALMRSVNPSLTPAQIRDILTTYTYRVPAMNGQYFTDEYGYGRLNAYRAVQVAAQPPPPAPPPAPTNLTVTGSPGSNPHLTWNASPGATEYEIWICSRSYTSPCPSFGHIGTTSGTSFTDPYTTVGSDCSGYNAYLMANYYVKARNSGGASPASNTVSICSVSGGPYAKAAFDLPQEYALGQSAPNPFSSSTDIRFDLPEAAHVRLAIYNLLGQEVRRLVDGEVDAGFHTVTFEAGDLSSGVYLYRLTAGDFTQTHRMVLTK